MKQIVKEINSNTGEERIFEIDIEQSQEEAAQARIAELKQKLKETDYQAIKYAEGAMTAAEYAPYKADRAKWRAEINELEKKL